MPIYTWKCKECGKVQDEVRPISEYDVTPPTKSPECTHDWEKMIPTGVQKNYGESWNTKKGYH